MDHQVLTDIVRGIGEFRGRKPYEDAWWHIIQVRTISMGIYIGVALERTKEGDNLEKR